MLKYMANICFLEIGIFCCNSAGGFHGISACEWHTVELLNRLNNLGVIHTSKIKFYDRRFQFSQCELSIYICSNIQAALQYLSPS